MIELSETELNRFNSRWAKVGDCHLWQGPLDKDGYGFFFFRKAGRRAHRVALLTVGRPAPADFYVNHTCRNRACVNPQHLECVTPSQSARKDSASLGYLNSQKTHCPKGHVYDRNYGGQRYCSTCESEKKKRLRAKWRAEGAIPRI